VSSVVRVRAHDFMSETCWCMPVIRGPFGAYMIVDGARIAVRYLARRELVTLTHQDALGAALRCIPGAVVSPLRTT
jgi:hypothetical protein